MPQQLLLEGPDLEALILRAREQYGPDCRIVRAEKVRSGGVMGFFAREHFELTVEVAASQAAKPVATPQASAPLDAALAAEIADAQAAREAMLAETVAAQPAASAIAPQVHEAAPQIQARLEPESTDMAEFDRLVMSMAQEAAQEVGAVSFVPAIFPQADSADAVIRGQRAATAYGQGSGAVAGLGGDAGQASDGAGAGAAPEPTQEVTPEEVLDHGATRADGVVLHRWGVFTDVATAVSTSCTVPALLALGVPVRYLSEYQDLASPVPLLEVVAKFGIPPVRRPEPGDLMVIAGPADEAVAVASHVAAWMQMPATAVVLAGEIEPIRGHGRRIKTVADAAAARRKADKVAAYGEPLIVALGVAPGRRGAAAAAPLLAAFNADAAWAVVDATKRAAVQEPELAMLSARGRIDALAALGTAEAQAPGALLNASLPIAWIDGLPAASVVWAALLGERIAERD